MDQHVASMPVLFDEIVDRRQIAAQGLFGIIIDWQIQIVWELLLGVGQQEASGDGHNSADAEV